MSQEPHPGHAQHFPSMALMVSRVNEHQFNPRFSDELNRRLEWRPNYDWTDDDILRKLAGLIAYSQSARASLIWNLMEQGVLDRVFSGFDVSAVASQNADHILRRHWPQRGHPRPQDSIGAFRFPTKVSAIIQCAQGIQRLPQIHQAGSFMEYLQRKVVPISISSMADFQRFWAGFDIVRQELLDLGMPFFGNFTSLCHLFMDLGFPAAKPDLIVMRTATQLGIVPSRSNDGLHPEPQRRYTIQTMQLYGLHQNLPTSVVDLYFLIHGGQTGVAGMVRPDYFV